MSRGKYIVIEGLTNHREIILQRLAHQLAAAQLPVKTFRDPESQNDPTARAIHRLTHDPRYPMTNRTEVLLYNAARSQSQEHIKEAADIGVICLADRNYLTTLTLHYYGLGTVPDYQKILQIIDFAVGDVEPDLTVVLDTPVAQLDSEVRRKFSAGSPELTEALLERVRAGYLWEAKQRNLPLVYAIDDVEKVFRQVWQYVAAVLAQRDKLSGSTAPQSVAEVLAANPPAKTAPAEPPVTTVLAQHAAADPVPNPAVFQLETIDEQATPAYFVPKKLTKKTSEDYRRTVGDILQNRAELINRLKAAKIDYRTAARLTLPVAVCYAGANRTALRDLLGPDRDNLSAAAREQLQETHNAAPTALTLADYWPRNELMLVPGALYAHTNLSLAQLTEQTDRWPYGQKADILTRAIRQGTSPVFASAGYTFDLMADYRQLLAARANGLTLQQQSLTPRYGYEVPEAVEASGLSDLFEACFDASLALHSRLQAAGFETEAQLATLTGHKLRLMLTVRPEDIFRLQADPPAELQPLLPELLRAIAGVHPLIGDVLAPQSKETTAQ
jgi:dTMP kinase